MFEDPEFQARSAVDKRGRKVGPARYYVGVRNSCVASRVSVEIRTRVTARDNGSGGHRGAPTARGLGHLSTAGGRPPSVPDYHSGYAPNALTGLPTHNWLVLGMCAQTTYALPAFMYMTD